MATSLLSHAEPARTQSNSTRLSVALTLGVWLLVVVTLGAAGAFVAQPGRPPIVLAIAISAPLLVFFASLRLSAAFRSFVRALDLRLLVGIQAWRWAGFGFLSLYTYKVLPAVFAFPAGLGDMAVGVTAPWMMFALLRQPAFATSTAFRRWNVLGILDLVLALGIGTVAATLSSGAPGEISTAPLSRLPLLLIPGFLVPIFLMLHTAALMQSRRG